MPLAASLPLSLVQLPGFLLAPLFLLLPSFFFLLSFRCPAFHSALPLELVLAPPILQSPVVVQVPLELPLFCCSHCSTFFQLRLSRRQ